MLKKVLLCIFMSALILSIHSACSRGAQPDLEAAVSSLSIDELIEDVKILSSDEFEGRFPASPGEEKTVNFIKDEFEKAGLKPGNGDSFFQEVPLVEITASPLTKLEITGGDKPLEFDYKEDFVAVTLRMQEKISLDDSDIVFVGYGIVAPEYQWNDYE
ncbi:MAG: peptidase M28, partial [Candidatus Aminicenantaceae bacterium]